MTGADLDQATRQALLELDPTTAGLDPATRLRADESLARILGTAQDTPGPIYPSRPPARRVRRLAIVGALAILVTVGVTGAQFLGGGNTAYATWTATPHPAATADQVAATSACRDQLQASLDTARSDPSGITGRALGQAATVLAEQRGDYTLVVLEGSGTLNATCVTQDAGHRGNSFASLTYREPIRLGPRDVLVTGGGNAGSKDDALNVFTGFVGRDVTGLTVHTAEHGDVTATVANGHIAAWWPGEAGTSPSDPTVGATTEATVTYSDGTSEARHLDLDPNLR